MSRRLNDNITSSYLEAANRLNSKNARRKIVAYVESYDDVFFWRSVLNKFENENLFFQVMLPSRTPHLERGKKAVLMSALYNKVGHDMIACVDADYDYLIQGKTETSHTIITNPYVFHTYAYAIENLQCYAPSLHEVSVMVTLNDNPIFDFEEFIRQFSITIFPLFVWNIWFYRTPHYGEFTITDFIHIIDIGTFKVSNVEDMIGHLRHKVGQKIQQLQHAHPDAKASYLQVKDDLKRLGVTPETTYLYIQGHHLFDKVVAPMLTRVCERLVHERETEISRQSVHYTQRNNELSCYTNSVEDVTAMLKKNTGYTESEPFRRIQNDVQNFINGSSKRRSLSSFIADIESTED